MNTRERLESLRKVEPTKYFPEELRECKVHSAMIQKGTGRSKVVTLDLFDIVQEIEQRQGNLIHAIGVRNGRVTYLILTK